jgi:glycosyltransferase involved in cell wall biosynthesis
MLQVASALTGEILPENTMFIATSGRLEFRNKGIDVYLDALAALRDALSRVTSLQRKVVAFVLVPSWMKSPRADLADNLSLGKPHRLFNPIITHNLYNPDSDPVYNRINALGIHNEPHDLVKVIDVPSYLNGDDGIFDMTYYDLLPGLDAAVFPSYYEPWGYTPLESAAFGVATITTDLAGFGQWVLDNFGDDSDLSGVKVVHRSDSNYNEAVQTVVSGLINLYMMESEMSKSVSDGARTTSKAASWENFIQYYDAAYRSALQQAEARNQQ